MKRTSKGLVNFPIGDSRYHECENGMSVTLVVIYRNDEYVDRWDAASGSAARIEVYGEIWQGDHAMAVDDALIEAYYPEAVQVIYPDYDQPIDHRFSIGYLAALTIGTVDTAFFSNELGYWRATFDDLTAEGHALVDTLKTLYPGQPLALLTFLDT